MTGRRRGLIVARAMLLLILLVVIGWLVEGHFEPLFLISILGVAAFLILLVVFQPFRRRILWVLNIIGEDEASIRKKPLWHFLLVSSISFIVCFYILLGDSQVTVPPVLQFNIIIVSSALGGLVLAAATISRVRNDERRELLSVAQKLIVATILFVFATALLFLVELSGGIAPNSFEPTTLMGWFRGICFWSTVICFFPGVILFALGIIDLVIALTHMRQNEIKT